MLSLSQVPHIPRFARADGERWESFGNTLPKGVILKKITSPKYCRINLMGWRSHASVVSAHGFAHHADKD